MINIGEQKVKEVVQEIHEAMLRKVKRGSQVKEEIVIENRIISIICTDFDLGPIKVSELMNEQYGYDLSVDDIILDENPKSSTMKLLQVIIWCKMIHWQC